MNATACTFLPPTPVPYTPARECHAGIEMFLLTPELNHTFNRLRRGESRLEASRANKERLSIDARQLSTLAQRIYEENRGSSSRRFARSPETVILTCRTTEYLRGIADFPIDMTAQRPTCIEQGTTNDGLCYAIPRNKSHRYALASRIMAEILLDLTDTSISGIIDSDPVIRPVPITRLLSRLFGNNTDFFTFARGIMKGLVKPKPSFHKLITELYVERFGEAHPYSVMETLGLLHAFYADSHNLFDRHYSSRGIDLV